MNAVETLLSFIFGLHLPLVCLLVLVYYILVKPYFRRRLSKRDRRLQSGAATAKPDPNRPRTPEFTVPFTLELAQQYHLPSYWSRRTEPIRKVNITPEARFIKLLVYNLWSPKDVGEGKDAVKVGKNKFIKITKVQRVENIALFGLYDENRQMFSRKEEKVQCFKDLSELSTSEVRTTLLIDTVPELARSPLGMEMYHDINEHYLFHGTLPYSVKSICRTGLSTYYASRVMFGKGVYTAESPTKSDQYTDVQGEEARHLEKKLFLCRVCLDSCRSKWQCNEGTCIAVSGRCDNLPDCPDESDEKNCRDGTCLEGQIRCETLNGSDCITADLCDCGPAPDIDNGTVTLNNQTFTKSNATANVSCDKGFETNQPTITCKIYGEWESSACEPVAVDGGWSEWSDWTDCSKTCDSGLQTRNRTCSEPSPAKGGFKCSGANTGNETCNEDACPVDGGWSLWSSWSECSQTCGSGLQTRNRTCDDPRNEAGCDGESTENQMCNKADCPDKIAKNIALSAIPLLGMIVIARHRKALQYREYKVPH